MSQDIFNACLGFVLQAEGGYVNRSSDLGGPTNQGITQTTYDHYRQAHKLSLQPVLNIAQSEVIAIYETLYWIPSYAYLLDYPLALTIFDTYVNFNPITEHRFVSKSLKQPFNGAWLQTLAKLRMCAPIATALDIIAQRKAFRHQRVLENPSQEIYLEGWLNRDNALMKEVQSPTLYKDQEDAQ
jgi:lysozyme family protein